MRRRPPGTYVEVAAAGESFRAFVPAALPPAPPVHWSTTQRRRFDDALATELAGADDLTLLCGRYEGFDERIVQHFCSDTLSIGRYVLAGGELAAMVVCDAVLRKLPGSLGHANSAIEESFSVALDGDPEYPHYTRPAEFRGWTVPEILLSGDHGRVADWRRERSRERSTERMGTP